MEKSQSNVVVRPSSFTLGTATIGSQNWQNSALRDIKLCQTLVNRSDRNVELGRSCDALPNLRDTAVALSNYEAHKYFREVRSVVNRLQESLLEINDEIKSLTRGKEALEKALENKRKDIKVNQDSMEVRASRPPKEKDRDGADDLLSAERQHLCNLKRSLESQLKIVQNHLQVMDAARAHVTRCWKERSRVMDLVCHNRPAATSGKSTPVGGRSDSRQCINTVVDPLGAVTPDVEEALREAADAKKEAKKLRGDIVDVISRTEQLRQAAMRSVNSGLRSKVHEMGLITDQLRISSGQTVGAIHRAQRWYDATDLARGFHLGPVSSANLMTAERLNRPIMRIYQRHPGTQMPEAQHLINSCLGLDESILNTHQNIQLLRLAKHRIHENIRSKLLASEVDRSVLRMRRRRADHRWTLGEAF